MSTKDDGGTALKQCRRCQEPFVPKPYQRAKGDYECPRCKRVRQNAANEQRDLSSYSRSRYAMQEVRAALRAYYQRKQTDPVYRLKRAARRKVATEIEAGRLQRQPCDVCGKLKSDAHHQDYSKPLDVRWLCRRCHYREEHNADTATV